LSGPPRMVDRSGSQANSVISFGPFRLYADERLLKKGDETLAVGGRALDILIALVEQAGEVVTRKELILRVWHDETVEETNLRVQINGLRKALGEGSGDARYVVNVSGRGYCFVAPVTRSPARRISPPVEAVAVHPLKNLPARLTRMVGRDGIVRTLSEQLTLWRFVSIVGPGGMGKTTVAVSVAHALSDGFDGAVFFVDLAPLTDPQLVPTAVASALGLMVQTQDPLVSLPALIGDREILLVLDNCEHVIDVAAPLAERLVSEAPHAHVLATSREALRVEGEHVHLLYALDCPPVDADLTAAKALRYPAAQLFMERAAASGYDSVLSDADAPSIARICQGLDGMALAIEIAAGRAGFYGIQGTEKLLDNRFRLLWHGRRTARPRHQTLNAMLDWSYNLLSEHEKLILCRLSVFVGDFTLDRASSVASEADADAADVTGAIVNLVAKSLISMAEINGSTYYRLLETTRAYAATKLAERGEADRIARRHAISYSKFLEYDATVQSTLRQNLSGYSEHIGNVRAALGWAFAERGDIAVGVELATWAAPLLIGLSLLEECRRWCERALAALDDASRGSRQEMILYEALALSSTFTKGHNDQVRIAIERGLALAEHFQDRPRQLRLLAGLNLYLMRVGDFAGALVAAEQGGAIAQAAQLPAGFVWAEWLVGIAHHQLGNQAAAQSHFRRGMELEVELGICCPDWNGYTRVGIRLGFARSLWLCGFPDQARRVANTAIDEAARENRPVPICISLLYASTVFLWTDELPRASDLIEQLIEYAGRHSLGPYAVTGFALKGELAIVRDDAKAGVDLLRTALATLRAEQYNVLLTVFIGVLAEGLRKTGKFEEALLTIDDGIALVTNSGVAFYWAELLRIKAQILVSMPQPDRKSAMGYLTEAIAVARQQTALALELRSATTLARLLSGSGQRDQARNVLTLVYDRFTEGFETADLRIARQILKDLA
jgi:predicted ATPase/DNA-binding winged helix-turn-helix (wHTH) protein